MGDFDSILGRPEATDPPNPYMDPKFAPDPHNPFNLPVVHPPGWTFRSIVDHVFAPPEPGPYDDLIPHHHVVWSSVTLFVVAFAIAWFLNRNNPTFRRFVYLIPIGFVYLILLVGAAMIVKTVCLWMHCGYSYAFDLLLGVAIGYTACKVQGKTM